MKNTIPIALTIAGSDSGGGAGIQADLKTFQAFGAFGTSVVTALTAQNTRGVHGIHAVPAAFVRAQLDAVASDLPPAALKTGMLATADIIASVAEGIERWGLGPLVVDPVMIATSGHRLLDDGAERALAARLLPRAAVVTPNLEEAALLTGAPVETIADMERAARALVARGAAAALVKGGHLPGDEVVDVLYDGASLAQWRRPRVVTHAGHGTGCTLSAAIAAGLAHGQTLHSAVEDALDFVHRAIAAAPRLGSANGPLNHLVPAHPDR